MTEHMPQHTPQPATTSHAEPAVARHAERIRNTPHDWLADLDKPVRGEKAVWVAVITQAMQDALSRSQKSEAKLHKHEAMQWLTGNSKDFIDVCLLAGLDPDYVRRKAKKALISPTRWRAEAGTSKRYAERKAYRARMKDGHAQQHQHSPPAIIQGPWAD
jgi:hypothetical protein